jgi:molybdopterin-guanine dinucleotide biosynthesis protein A
MLLIGAAGRNAGKTEFACAVVRRLSATHEVVAAKVTTVHDEGGGGCPRGGRGCGVCGQLAAPFELSEERGCGAGPEGGKDTVRLRESGARRVFWLRARSDALGAAAAALLAQVGPRTLCVCESNSLRRVLEPGLFLLVRGAGERGTKASAAAVADLVDAEVLSDGARFTPPPEDFEVVEGARWGWRRPATLIVLAGGRSRRMGQDKALLPIDGRPLIERVVQALAPHFAEVLVSVAEPGRYEFLGRRTVVDRQPGEGPLMGLASALAASSHDVNLVVPCDAPDVSVPLALRLLRAARGADAAVPRTAEGRPEPLFAVYRRRTLPRLEAALAAGERTLRHLYPALAVRWVDLPAGAQVANLNTMDDYVRHARRGPAPEDGPPADGPREPTP